MFGSLVVALLAQASVPAPVVVPRPAQPDPRVLTAPVMDLVCDMSDEAHRRFPLRLRRTGGRGYLVLAGGGRASVQREPSAYALTSPDPRFAGWRNVENTVDQRGIQFAGPDGLIAVAQLDEDNAQRRKQAILNLFVSENLAAVRLTRYTGFCDATMMSQRAAPDRRK